MSHFIYIYLLKTLVDDTSPSDVSKSCSSSIAVSVPCLPSKKDLKLTQSYKKRNLTKIKKTFLYYFYVISITLFKVNFQTREIKITFISRMSFFLGHLQSTNFYLHMSSLVMATAISYTGNLLSRKRYLPISVKADAASIASRPTRFRSR